MGVQFILTDTQYHHVNTHTPRLSLTVFFLFRTWIRVGQRGKKTWPRAGCVGLEMTDGTATGLVLQGCEGKRVRFVHCLYGCETVNVSGTVRGYVTWTTMSAQQICANRFRRKTSDEPYLVFARCLCPVAFRAFPCSIISSHLSILFSKL